MSKTKPGDSNYRAYVGPPSQYDFMGATQFNLVTLLGLNEKHTYLDIGCGSLRAGKFIISYLYPDRYYGIEPNSHLWKESIKREIGNDLIKIKNPHFDNNTDFNCEIFKQKFDFIVAQSIYSHTGKDLLLQGLSNSAKVLKPGGQILFTALSEGSGDYNHFKKGVSTSGWIYPGCVTFTEDEVIDISRTAGLYVQKLDWFHPRQTWYRAVASEDFLLTEQQAHAIGKGRPLFDDRFQ